MGASRVSVLSRGVLSRQFPGGIRTGLGGEGGADVWCAGGRGQGTAAEPGIAGAESERGRGGDGSFSQ